MADPFTDPVVITVVLAGVALAIAAAYFEMRFIHKKMKNRRVRAAKQDASLPDDAHNAIVTTKAIAATLERQGIRSHEVTAWIHEAEMANQRGNYRVTKDLMGKAEDRLSARAAEGKKVEIPATPSKRPSTAVGVSDRACPSCGASLKLDDVFCRKCGTRLVSSSCASCGASLLSDDAFCPKCGTPVSH